MFVLVAVLILTNLIWLGIVLALRAEKSELEDMLVKAGERLAQVELRQARNFAQREYLKLVQN